mmetsp:Transcript_7236/g.10857  ORF Transcript_7236/g.10857 Transcript_7236/m.10857 type:complete len:233 (-) Transcript_7236:212-910(-)
MPLLPCRYLRLWLQWRGTATVFRWAFRNTSRRGSAAVTSWASTTSGRCTSCFSSATERRFSRLRAFLLSFFTPAGSSSLGSSSMSKAVRPCPIISPPISSPAAPPGGTPPSPPLVSSPACSSSSSRPHSSSAVLKCSKILRNSSITGSPGGSWRAGVGGWRAPGPYIPAPCGSGGTGGGAGAGAGGAATIERSLTYSTSTSACGGCIFVEEWLEFSSVLFWPFFNFFFCLLF